MLFVREPVRPHGFEEDKAKSVDPVKSPAPQFPDVEIAHEVMGQFVASVFEKNASQVVNPEDGVIVCVEDVEL